MRMKVAICNICGIQKDSHDETMVQLNVSSSRFRTYANCDELFANRSKWDLCDECIAMVAQLVNERRVQENKE